MDTIIYVSIVYTIIFFIFIYGTLYIILHYYRDVILPSTNRRRSINNRIHPDLIQLQQIHNEMTISSRYIQQRQDVMEQLKNTVVIINADNSIQLGLKN